MDDLNLDFSADSVNQIFDVLKKIIDFFNSIVDMLADNVFAPLFGKVIEAVADKVTE